MQTRAVSSSEENRLECHPGGVTGSGNAEKGVVIVGIAPGGNEVKEGQVLVGQSGKLLNAILKAVGWPREDTYATNLLCWWNNKPTTAQIDQCNERFTREVKACKPKLIIALGKIATEYLTGHKFADASGCPLWSEEFDCWVMGTNHPAAALRGLQSAVSELVRDLSKVSDVVTWPRDKGRVDYEVIHKPQVAQGILDSIITNVPGPMALDVETIWGTHEITCLAISDGNKAFVFPRPVLDAGLNWPVVGVQWTYHNSMFDPVVMRDCLGVELPTAEDTMLMSYSLDERTGGRDDGYETARAAGIHGLKRLSREYCGAEFYNVDTREAEGEELWEYNAKDAAYTARLAKMFIPRQEADGVRDMYRNYLLKAAEVVPRQKAHGIYISKRRLYELGFLWSNEMLELMDELEHEAWQAGWQGHFNPASPVQVAKLLYDYMGLPYTEYGRTTKRDALEALEEVSPFVRALLRYRKVERLMNTYVRGLDDKMDEYGRVHPDILIHGTVTGRWSYRNPPIQTIPKHHSEDNIRGIFAAPNDDYEILQADYRQAELWTNYMYSSDPMILQDLSTGDFHSPAAESMYEVKREDFTKDEWEAKRDDSKTVTFGIAFGRQAKAVGRAIGRSTQEARELIEKWFQRYNKYGEWYKAERQTIIDTGEQQALSGRKRRYHLVLDYSSLNQAVNFPIQSTSHDVLMLSMIELYWLLQEFDSHVLFEVHDSIIVEVNKKYRDEVVQLVKRVMEKPRFNNVSIPVEIKVGPTWAEVEDVA